MRYCYQALLDVFDEAKQEMIKEGREFSVKYVLDEVRHTYSHTFPICWSSTLKIIISRANAQF